MFRNIYFVNIETSKGFVKKYHSVLSALVIKLAKPVDTNVEFLKGFFSLLKHKILKISLRTRRKFLQKS